MHVSLCRCRYICSCARINTCMCMRFTFWCYACYLHVHVHVQPVQAQVHMNEHVCVYLYVYMHVYICRGECANDDYLWEFVCVCVCVCVCDKLWVHSQNMSLRESSYCMCTCPDLMPCYFCPCASITGRYQHLGSCSLGQKFFQERFTPNDHLWG
jgi:hypothetical protein